MTLAATTELFQALSDASRLRMLAVLSRHPLSVAELVESLGLVQSRVSAHLARLKEAGLVQNAKDGSASRWALDASSLDEAGQRIWSAMAPEWRAPQFAKDAERAAAAVARRSAPKGSWPESVAGEMEKHYSPGRTWESMAHALSSLLSLGDVLDVGAGDGTLAALVAPHARSYVCLDQSERLVTAAKARLARLANVQVERGDAVALPFADASFDVVFLLNVLSCLSAPQEALAEAARVLRPEGRLLVVTLDRHEHLDLVSRFGHVAPGIAPARLRSWLERTSFRPEKVAVTSHERREPRFGVVTATATKLPTNAPTKLATRPRVSQKRAAERPDPVSISVPARPRKKARS